MGFTPGRLSDIRIASFFFYLMAIALTTLELGKTTAFTFRKKYTMARFVTINLLLLHAIFGALCSYWVGNEAYGTEAYGFLVLTCLCNWLYQTGILFLIRDKMTSLIATGGFQMKLFKHGLMVAIILKGVLSLGSMGYMFYAISTYTPTNFFLNGASMSGLVLASSANLAGNLMYALLLTVVQLYVVKNLFKSTKARSRTMTGGGGENTTAIVMRRQQAIACFFGIISIFLLVLAIAGQIYHSIALAFLAMFSVPVLKYYDDFDASAVGGKPGQMNPIQTQTGQTRSRTESSMGQKSPSKSTSSNEEKMKTSKTNEDEV